MPSGDFVYEIKGVDFIPFEGSHLYNQPLNQDVQKYVDGIKKLLEA